MILVNYKDNSEFINTLTKFSDIYFYGGNA